MIFDYFAGGANSQATLKDNRVAFTAWRLLPRILVDVSKVDTSLELLGEACIACLRSQAGILRF
jgi:isopentenyl diphosphate isomerase/L-lactate dehydrogenase-like FMN-dependent dehydrogenase